MGWHMYSVIALHDILGAPPQPSLAGRATSTIKRGFFGQLLMLLPNVLYTMAQSLLLRGDQIFQPSGQESFFSAPPDRETVANLDQLISRVSFHREVRDIVAGRARLFTALRCNNKHVLVCAWFLCAC